MKKKIAIFTTTRADFGIFTTFLREIEKSKSLEYLLFVGGAHLAYEFGATIEEIHENGFKISDTFDYLLNDSTACSLSKSSGICTMELANLFKKYEFDFVCVLGDRFELLSIVQNAIIFCKPIIHLSGGEITEGVIDEQIRHMITKAAHIHFVSCEEYKDNVHKMGESIWRIFNVGELSIDNLVHTSKIPKKELFENLDLDISKETILLTYHPVTLEFNISPLQQIQNIFSALDNFDFQVIITAPNSEINRNEVMKCINQKVESQQNYHFFDSLGVKRYISMLPNCKFVIGNSSSGVVEAPFFKIPTINIGDRQKGRLRHPSIIDTNYEIDSINNGIKKAISEDFLKNNNNFTFKFGKGNTAKKMIGILSKIEINQDLMRKKLDF